MQQAIADYQRQAQGLAALLANEAPKATALLGRKIADLQAYLAITAASGALPAMSGAASDADVAAGPSQLSAGALPSGSLGKALDVLAASQAGQAVAQAISTSGVQVRFGETGQNTIAHFDPQTREIVLSQDISSASSNVLAAHLAHEGTHVQWANRRYSLDEEYHAFHTQAEVWNELKGAERDEQCDQVSSLIALGERRAKRRLRSMYPNLPEYP